MERQKTIETLNKSDLVDRILDLGSQVTNIEREMNSLAELLETSYGVSVDDVLLQRESEEKQNGDQE